MASTSNTVCIANTSEFRSVLLNNKAYIGQYTSSKDVSTYLTEKMESLLEYVIWEKPLAAFTSKPSFYISYITFFARNPFDSVVLHCEIIYPEQSHDFNIMYPIDIAYFSTVSLKNHIANTKRPRTVRLKVRKNMYTLENVVDILQLRETREFSLIFKRCPYDLHAGSISLTLRPLNRFSFPCSILCEKRYYGSDDYSQNEPWSLKKMSAFIVKNSTDVWKCQLPDSLIPYIFHCDVEFSGFHNRV